MDTQFGNGLLQEEVEGLKVWPHLGVVHSEESEVGGPVQEVSQTHESLCSLHVEQQHGCQEGHPLDVANVRSVAGVRSQDIVQTSVVWPSLERDTFG